MSKINIEIKAKSNNHNEIRNLLLSKNAFFKGTDHQIDTYFKVNNGRLKLREGNIENNLIHYNRNNESGPKMSEFTLYKPAQNEVLKDILTKSMDVLVVVDKKREIYYIENIKFHLDTVENLGTFVEIEAEGKDESEKESLLKQCNHYIDLFKIQEDDLISISYSDLLLNGK